MQHSVVAGFELSEVHAGCQVVGMPHEVMPPGGASSQAEQCHLLTAQIEHAKDHVAGLRQLKCDESLSAAWVTSSCKLAMACKRETRSLVGGCVENMAL